MYSRARCADKDAELWHVIRGAQAFAVETSFIIWIAAYLSNLLRKFLGEKATHGDPAALVGR